MKNLLTISRKLAGPVLLASWGCALAQSLGSPSADLWVGRPLELSVPARFASADSRDECVHAEVFYGDGRVAAGRVRATVTGPADSRRVQVHADAVVDEPVVTVSLRAGCTSTVTRTYTLLPDMPSEAVVAGIVLRQAGGGGMLAAGAAPSPMRLANATSSPLRLASTSATSLPGPRSRPSRALTPMVAEAPMALRSTAPDAASRGPRMMRVRDNTPRLRLEPAELDARTMLRITAILSAPGDEARRQTAALLWQALNADPNELLRTSVRLQQLENELAQVRQAAGSTRDEMAALRQRLDSAQAWYTSPTVAQILALLVLAAAAAAGVLAWRTRQVSASPWAALEPELPPQAPQEPVMGVAPQPVAAPVQRSSEPPQPRDLAARTSGQAPLAASAPVAAAVPLAPTTRATAAAFAGNAIEFDMPVVAPSHAPATATRRPATGLLRVETLAATFEEVEFLASLGLWSDAMDVLKGYLEDSASPAPLAYFELMRLCAHGDDTQAVEAVRRRYAQVFRIEAPRLEQVTAPFGLESSQALSERIVRNWGTAEALQVIEQCLFDVPRPATALTLQAGRDLICLYDVGMTLVTQADDSTGDGGHALAPWADADSAGEAHAAVHAAAEASGGHVFGLDVDLNAAHEVLSDPVLESDFAELMERQVAESAAAARKAASRVKEEEDAFSAAMASERTPLGRL